MSKFYVSFNGKELKVTSRCPTYWLSNQVVIMEFEDKRNANSALDGLLEDLSPACIALAEMRVKYAEAVGTHTVVDETTFVFHTFKHNRWTECYTLGNGQVQRSVKVDGAYIGVQVASL